MTYDKNDFFCPVAMTLQESRFFLSERDWLETRKYEGFLMIKGQESERDETGNFLTDTFRYYCSIQTSVSVAYYATLAAGDFTSQKRTMNAINIRL